MSENVSGPGKVKWTSMYSNTNYLGENVVCIFIIFNLGILFDIVPPWTTLKRKISPLGGEDLGCGIIDNGIL